MSHSPMALILTLLIMNQNVNVYFKIVQKGTLINYKLEQS